MVCKEIKCEIEGTARNFSSHSPVTPEATPCSWPPDVAMSLPKDTELLLKKMDQGIKVKLRHNHNRFKCNEYTVMLVLYLSGEF